MAAATPMLKLSLIRHAKSSWADPELDDHERPLSPRGTKAALRMANFIAKRDLIPEIVLCSDAVRARATMTLLVSRWPQPAPPVIIEPELYLAHPDIILKVLARDSNDNTHVMILGHNPGLHALALSLIGSGARDSLVAMAMKFPTAALAHIHFDEMSWADIAPATGRLKSFVSPRDLKR